MEIVLPRHLAESNAHTFITEENAEQLTKQLIERGRTHALNVINQIVDESTRRVDYLVAPADLRFGAQTELILPEHGSMTLSDHALNGVLDDMHIPNKFFRDLSKDGHGEEASVLLNDLKDRIPSKRLIRVVDGSVKGWLSENYNPIDQREIITSFVESLQSVDAIPVAGEITEWRYALTALGGQPFAPLANEWLIQAVQLRSSDYGGTAVSLSESWVRLICSNLATGQKIFRQIHLGKHEWRIESGLQVSRKTLELSSKATVSAMTDAIKGVFSAEHCEKIIRQYIQDSTDHIDVDARLSKLGKRGLLSSGEQATLGNLIRTNTDIAILPQTEDPEVELRLQAALSYFANSVSSEKKLRLTDAAAGIEEKDE